MKRTQLVITPKSPRLRESGLLDECAPEILRCAQDDSQGVCHPERSEGSRADLGVITSKKERWRADLKPCFVLSLAHIELFYCVPLVVDSVTLSVAKGLAPGEARCFAALSMTRLIDWVF